MSLYHQFENFDNFHITISLTKEYIYFRVLNSITYINYEGNITISELQKGNIRSLDKAYLFFIKCFEKKPKHNISILIQMSSIELDFNAELDEYFTAFCKIELESVETTSEMEVSSSLLRLEAKQKSDIEMLSRRISDMEKMLSILSFTEICIGDVWVIHYGWTNPGHELRTRTIQRLYLPFSIKTLNLIHKNTRCANNHSEIQNIGLDENHTTIQRQADETYTVRFNHLYWNKLRLLPNLTKILYTRDITAEQAHNQLVGGDDSRFSNPFDFGIFNNNILEDLTIVNFPAVSTLTTIEKIQSLKVIHIDNADQLSNACEYIKLLPNLKKLTFTRCPKIISEDSGKLNKYCADHNIEINIS